MVKKQIERKREKEKQTTYLKNMIFHSTREDMGHEDNVVGFKYSELTNETISKQIAQNNVNFETDSLTITFKRDT